MKAGGNQKEILDSINAFLLSEKPLSFDECIVWARHKFEAYFNNSILQLLYNFPKDSVSTCIYIRLPRLELHFGMVQRELLIH
jgi:ubiquitin-activating enzyme E1